MTLPFVLAGFVAARNAKALDTVLIPSEVKVALMLLLALVFAYKMIPSTRVKLSAAVIGASVGATGLILLRAFYGMLTEYVFYYSKLYGSIAAIPVLMIWILNMWYIILFGAGLTAGLNQDEQT